MWRTLSVADYYGGSVTLGLSPLRRSRVPFNIGRIERNLGVPFISLNRVIPHRPPDEGYESRTSIDPFPAASSFRRCIDERLFALLEIRIQAV
jgi:hypothetical protein